MTKKNSVAAIALVLTLGAILVGCTPAPADNANSGTTSSATSTFAAKRSLSKDEVSVELEFTADQVWKYNLATNLPTPCHNIAEQSIVRESYPEQVTIEVDITNPAADVVCAQVVTPVSKDGTIRVSRDATFDLKVTRK